MMEPHLLELLNRFVAQSTVCAHCAIGNLCHLHAGLVMKVIATQQARTIRKMVEPYLQPGHRDPAQPA
jgi:hydrogenase maturation factor